MRLEEAVTEMLLAKDYTATTARHRRAVLDEFIAFAHAHGVETLDQVTRPFVRRYIADLRERVNVRYGGHLSGETQHGRASVVRAFLNFCVYEEWLDERITRHFEMPKMSKKVLHILSRDQYRLLVRATTIANDNTALVLRDQAILAMLMDSGARAMEVCGLRLDDVFISQADSYLHIRGKGRREREIGLGKQAALAMHRYRTRARPRTKEALPYFFLSHRRAPLTPNAIDRMLTRLKRTAGEQHFVGIRLSAHTLRHSYAVHFLQQGGELFKLSRLLGHESVQTTQRYLAAFTSRDARLTSRSVLDGL